MENKVSEPCYMQFSEADKTISIEISVREIQDRKWKVGQKQELLNFRTYRGPTSFFKLNKCDIINIK